MRAAKPTGVTLIEVVVSTLLVGVVLVASLDNLGSATRVTREVAGEVDANTLLSAMLAEAMALPLVDPELGAGPLGQETGELALTTDRTAVDDLDDLAGYATSPPQVLEGFGSPPTYRVATEYTGWTQRFDVTYASAAPNGSATLTVPVTDEGLRLVVCEATSPAGVTYRVEAVRAVEGLEATQNPFDADRLVGVRVEVAVGGGASVKTAVSTRNKPEAP